MYKPGDRVRVVELDADNFGDYTIGDIATVAGVLRDGSGDLMVSWETNLLNAPEDARCSLLYQYEVELVS